MDCTLEESSQEAESLGVLWPDGSQEDGGEDGLSEIFQLLQMDVEHEHREEEARPANSAAWGSELSRLAAQIRRLYGSNKKASRPFWICLTGFSTDSPLYEECLRMNDGFSAYLLDVTEEDCFSLFPLESLVYLTPDSEQALEDLDQNTVYVIGGLVDESIQKVMFDILSTYFETHSWPEALKKGVSPGKGYILRNPVDDGQPKIPDGVGEAPKVS
ncbi:tRNA methyltransferase 10-like protein B [Microtus ochrogaster]|uniref:tRNA (guanine(9)-N(1))-methyltransferase n=1 Tax=Microtus ochrogaster TaxID=79684 RepID=A0A8J6KUY4_MICOH|nr:tRNA methyltransferase 10-like protein B [Microtus ochrogaster]